jgi:outer membrane protein assembly factor BamB/tRNA A-37 threonylcarbamoyl transferase component Bud32
MEAQLEDQNLTQHLTEKPGGTTKQLKLGSALNDRYAIQDVIGIGGMGSVYRARDLHFPNVVKLVAVKEMINQANDPVIRNTIIQNFEREANILVTMNHPCIPKIFDFFSINERSYLVEEYVQGKDLEAVLNENPNMFLEDQVVSWAIELCDVLTYIHSHKPEPIIFRDMKPSNIMVTSNNHIMLVDFGIAKIFKVGMKGTMIGTEGYSPPEQYRGEATPVADVYSLGATMHHLLTHRDPRLEAPFTFAERPIRKYNPSVSVEMEEIINRCLLYEPRDRFQSAEELKDALLAAAKRTGVLGRLNLGPKPVSSEQTIKPMWAFRCEDEIRGSPAYDGGYVYVGAYDNNLYSVNAADGSLTWKYATEGGIVGKPAISNGVVYIGSEDKRLYALSVRTGKMLWTYYTEGAIRSSPWIAEGQIFIGSDDGSVYAINVTTNHLTWKVQSGAPVRSTPFYADDKVFFGNEQGDFTAVDLRGQVLWKSHAKKEITSSPVELKGFVYFTSLDGVLYCMDSKSGWSIWRFRMGRGSISSPCIANNFICAGSADGNIYCIEGASAREVWRFKTNHQVSGSPIFYKDAIYCGSADGNLYCIEIKNGQLRWKFNTGGPITGTPVIFNDVLYIGSADHLLYSLVV